MAERGNIGRIVLAAAVIASCLPGVVLFLLSLTTPVDPQYGRAPVVLLMFANFAAVLIPAAVFFLIKQRRWWPLALIVCCILGMAVSYIRSSSGANEVGRFWGFAIGAVITLAFTSVIVGVTFAWQAIRSRSRKAITGGTGQTRI